MRISISMNPMPAKRMTGKTRFYGQAKDYVEYKHKLADLIRLVLQGRKIDDVAITDKLPVLPSVLKLKITCKFYRDSNRPTDVDNLLKMAMDLCQTAGIIKNDTQVCEAHAYLYKGNKIGRFEIELLEEF